MVLSATEGILEITSEAEVMDNLEISKLKMYFKPDAGGTQEHMIWYNSKSMTSVTVTHLYQYGVVYVWIE